MYSSHLNFAKAFVEAAQYSPYSWLCWLLTQSQLAMLTAMLHWESLGHTLIDLKGSWRGPVCSNLEWGHAIYCSDFAIIGGAALKVKAKLYYCHLLSCSLERSKAGPKPVAGAYLNLARQAATRQQQMYCKLEHLRCHRCCSSCWPAKAGLLDRRSRLDQDSNFAKSPSKRSYSNIGVRPSASQTYSLCRLRYNKNSLSLSKIVN